VIVSPYVTAGSVIRPPDDARFDHTTIIATLRALFDIGPLTARDAAAPTLLPALTEHPRMTGRNSSLRRRYLRHRADRAPGRETAERYAKKPDGGVGDVADDRGERGGARGAVAGVGGCGTRALTRSPTR